MKQYRELRTVTRALIIIVAGNIASALAAQENAVETHRVLVELYSSQNWTACPNAEEFLGTLADEYGLEKIVPLSIHVTYGDNGWQRGDRNKWQDTFASSEMDERHKPHLFGRTNMSIPNFVVDNTSIRPSFDTEMPDAKKREVRAAIDKALATKPVIHLIGTLSAETVEKPKPQGILKLDLQLKEPGKSSAIGGKVRIVPVLVKKTTSIKPKSGWNKGKVLVDHFVVVDILKNRDPKEAMGRNVLSLKMDLPESEDAEAYCVAILLEDQKTGRTLESNMFFLNPEGKWFDWRILKHPLPGHRHRWALHRAAV